MTLPSSGQISISEIKAEYGWNYSSNSLAELSYYNGYGTSLTSSHNMNLFLGKSSIFGSGIITPGTSGSYIGYSNGMGGYPIFGSANFPIATTGYNIGNKFLTLGGAFYSSSTNTSYFIFTPKSTAANWLSVIPSNFTIVSGSNSLYPSYVTYSPVVLGPNYWAFEASGVNDFSTTISGQGMSYSYGGSPTVA